MTPRALQLRAIADQLDELLPGAGHAIRAVAAMADNALVPRRYLLEATESLARAAESVAPVPEIGAELALLCMSAVELLRGPGPRATRPRIMTFRMQRAGGAVMVHANLDPYEGRVSLLVTQLDGGEASLTYRERLDLERQLYALAYDQTNAELSAFEALARLSN